jgi:hypothetical protein
MRLNSTLPHYWTCSGLGLSRSSFFRLQGGQRKNFLSAGARKFYFYRPGPGNFIFIGRRLKLLVINQQPKFDC